MRKLYAARDEHIEQIESEAKDYVNNYIKQFKIPKLMDIYREFIIGLGEKTDDDNYEVLKTISRITLADLDRKRIQSSDIPPLIMLQESILWV